MKNIVNISKNLERLNMEWYKLMPQDAFFVRTAEPMEIGESHSGSFLFPPPASTFCGAFRTLALFKIIFL
jgi:CRISPR-associated protein Cmr3